MAVTGVDVTVMDVMDRATRRIPRQRVPFRARNAVASLRVGTNKQPTEFGYQLLKLIADAGLKPASLARAAGTSGSTITRLVYGGVGRPDSDTLERLARALAHATLAPTATPTDVEEAVKDLHNQLLHGAGYRLGAAPPSPGLHRYAAEVNQMIGPSSPLPPEDVEFLEVMIDRLIDPYRRKLRRRTG